MTPVAERRTEHAASPVRRIGRGVVLVLLAILVGTLLWWSESRATADARRLSIHDSPAEAAFETAFEPATGGAVRILAWNIAHGRGDAEQGILQNWRGGSFEERLDRLVRMAGILQKVDADVVVLNEVDFDAGWSDGVDQAEFLAHAAGYPRWVEQRNFDFRLPFESYAFGNAVLSRLPILEARWVELPAHSAIEEAALGSKEGAVVRLQTTRGPVAVVAVHLEYRSEETRLAAVPALEALRDEEAAPLALAGDFNTAPAGWPGVAPPTAIDTLLRLGWGSPRAEAAPSAAAFTFPTYAPRESRDWILVESPLRIREARVVPGARDLSDHAPVLSVVEIPRATESPSP